VLSRLCESDSVSCAFGERHARAHVLASRFEKLSLSPSESSTYEDALGTKLRVDGLPPSFSTQHLKDLFAPFGTVLSAWVITDPGGQSLRMGEVEMSTPGEAQKAKGKLHRSYVQGTLLLVFEHGDKDRLTGLEKKETP
jgi:hypothetical protein